MRLILWPAHSHGHEREAEADLPLDFVGLEVGRRGAVVDLAQAGDPPEANSAASASDVLPVPPWPSRTTLRICSVLYSFMPGARS